MLAPVRLDATGLRRPGLRDRVRRYELAVIRRAIADAGGDRRLAARRLGIGLSSLYRKLGAAVGGAG